VFVTYCLVFVIVFGVTSANKPAYNDVDEVPGRDTKLSRTRLLRAGAAGIHHFHGYEDGNRPQQQHQHHNVNHPHLNEISDPKTVDLKPEPPEPEPQHQLPPPHMVDKNSSNDPPDVSSTPASQTKALEPLPSSAKNIAEGPAPLSILSLGGSVTWGATLEDRMKAYPWMVGNSLGGAHVDNLAYRATGADFPSLCVESLIDEEGSAERSYDLVSVCTVLLVSNAILARERSCTDMHAAHLFPRLLYVPRPAWLIFRL
jgi:hypothetical protein